MEEFVVVREKLSPKIVSHRVRGWFGSRELQISVWDCESNTMQA
jgi:hypothetical protein